MIGRTISHYRIVGKLGEGGMGVVYRAVDTRLDRPVAIKFLPPEAVADPERKGRFVREAKAASALNHPNIVTIYDIGSGDGLDFIAMEQIEGEPLDRRIGPHGLPVEEALRYGEETAGALAAAHAAGIVHRDVKPANIMVTTAGRVKVLDFGLAKLIERRVEGAPLDSRLATATGVPPATAATKYTREGTVLGTLAYMSPEQVEGKPADARTDVFALGAVIYEMLAGRRPFHGDSTIGVMTAILRDAPPPLKSVRADVPTDVERIVRRCLEKNPDSRYPSARELAQELSDARKTRERPSAALTTVLRQPRYAIPAFLLILAALGGAAWVWMRGSRARWARNEALPEIARLVETDRIGPAFFLAREAARYIPEDRELQRLWRNVSIAASIATDPPGAGVSFKPYTAAHSEWQPIGRSPIEKVRLPDGYVRFRIEKEGYEPFEGVPEPEPGGNDAVLFHIALSPKGSSPPGMIAIGAGRYAARHAGAAADVPAFWLDKYEVTNAAFKAFVERGGYRDPGYWKHPFVKDGRHLRFEVAVSEFRDGTGRPGPATWELGSYPEGHADFPVGGVSWYEAAAYAEFAGNSLPTLYHWSRAANFGVFSDILELSNFGGDGPVRVGSLGGVGPFGTYDMAGNVKEWCSNESDGRRYLAGGAWNEPSYVYDSPAVESPFARRPTYGFRCAKFAAPPDPALTAPIEKVYRDYSKEKPVPDEAFRVYEGLYSYDQAELSPAVEAVDDTSPHWRREKIRFDAAYGGERVIAWLFLPKNAAPPYQTVVYFPDSTAELFRSSENAPTRYFDFIMRSGRALLFPVYKGMYERRTESARPGPGARRDLLIQWAKDLGRSIDYLETRKDIDGRRLAFYGFSLGAVYAPVLTAVEKRFKASIVLGGGFSGRPIAPEAEALNFAPRVRVPTLMISGREDFIRPVEISQRPLFNMLGTTEKRLAVIEGGHVPPKIQPLIKEILDWLDRYLGPVRTRA